MLAAGTRLGLYEVLSSLGAGGMGEVYRARDTKLRRDVALKILPPLFAADPDRRARFTREAHVLASLNHPHIASIYGIEEADGVTALVLELVEGPTLAERLGTWDSGLGIRSESRTPKPESRQALPIAEALTIAAQIADALDAAHEKGIIHRDLKPANIKLTEDGRVKVLDFGLAKALGPAEAGHYGDDVAQGFSPADISPTMTAMASRLGVIVGTAAYMSPEQAKGKPVDKRSDIWAFGCVLFEMLTGQRAFAGEDVTDYVVAVMTKEPDWSLLPPATPPRVVDLLQQCLKKDRRERLRDIGDAHTSLDRDLETPDRPLPRVKNGWRWLVATLIAAAAIVVAVTLAVRPRTHAMISGAPVRLSIRLPQSAPLFLPDPDDSLAISPDGSRIVYATLDRGTRRLMLRNMNDFDARLITGTDGARAPCFSPDGRWVAFTANGHVQKISLSGGPAVILADTKLNMGLGTAWAGRSVYYAGDSGIMQVSADGGEPAVVAKPDGTKGQWMLSYPDVVPDGRAVIFTVATNTLTSYDDASIVAQRLDTGERRVLVQGGAHGRYVRSGHLVYVRGGAVMAVRMDPSSLQVSGAPIRILDGGMLNSWSGAADVAVSDSGTLVFAPGGPANVNAMELVSMDARGVTTSMSSERRAYAYPSLSPDATRLAVTARAALDDVWICDLRRQTFTRLTFTLGNNWCPVWTPDGKRIVFASDRSDGSLNIYWKSADGSGPEERLTHAQATQVPTSIAPDARTLVYAQADAKTGFDLWLLSLADRRTTPFLQTPFNERQAMFSPDGQWLVYTSDESGHDEVYVRPCPGPGSRIRISTDIGSDPRWSRNGHELFYRRGDVVMRAAITMTPVVTVGVPAAFATAPTIASGFGLDYDVAADGRRIVVLADKGLVRTTTDLSVVLNWFTELRAAVPEPR